MANLLEAGKARVKDRYRTNLSPDEEVKFQSWVKKNNVPFDLSDTAPDYDMRGFWKAQQSGDPRAQQSSENLHFPDTWKTPRHTTFSNESIYADKTAPKWQGSQLVGPTGRVIADESVPGAEMTGLPPIASPGAIQPQIDIMGMISKLLGRSQ